MKPAISVCNLSKCYKIGVISRQTLVDEFSYWWTKMRGRDPREQFTKIGHTSKKANRFEAESAGQDRFWALKDVSFKIHPGEIVGIIGRNGAGKSTLLKILTRITEPTKGEVVINGRMGALLEVGTGFHPELTGRENVYMKGTILGMKKFEIDAKFDEIVAFSEIEKFIDTPVKRYSSGMYVRLAFAVAAHLNVETMIIDEVLAVGDSQFQKKCLRKMGEVSSAGRTVLFVSHNMPVVQTICKKSILLKEGTLFQEGNTDDIVSVYLSDDKQVDDGVYVFSEKDTSKVVWIDSAVLKCNGKCTGIVQSGQSIVIAIQYNAKAVGYRCAIHIGIYNNYGDKLIHLATGYDGIDYFYTKHKGTVYCTIPKMPLQEGKYILNISLYLDGKPYHKVKNAMTMIVEKGNFYGNGKSPSPRQSIFLVEQNWRISDI